MFRRKKKKLYKIIYEEIGTYNIFIAAKNEIKAIKKFYRKTRSDCIRPTIISFEEYEAN